MFDLKNTKYHVQYTSRFKKEYKKVIKQGKNKEKFLEVLNKIANGEELETKYRNHKLIKRWHKFNLVKAARKAAFLFLPIARIYHNPFLPAPRRRHSGRF